MERFNISARRPVGLLILLAALTGLFGACSPQASQGGSSRIPDTSVKSTATAKANRLPVVTVSAQQRTQPAALPSPSLYASPTATSAPTDTVTPQPQVAKVDPACLVGTWQVANLPDAMSQSYAQSGSTLQLQTVDGRATYAFDANGSMTITFSHLDATFTGNIDNHDVTARQGLDGSGTAHYQVNSDEGQVIFSDFGGQGLLSTLDINGQRIAEGNIPVWRAFSSSLTNDNSAPASLIEYSRAAVTCQNNAMTIQAIEPLPGPAVTLTRK